MTRRLEDIDLDEVSLVDIPAIKRKFLIVKKQNKEGTVEEELTLEDVEEKEVKKELSDGDKEVKAPESAKVEETEKTGRKLSKTTIEKIQSIIKDLSSLIEEVEDVVGETTEVKKAEIDWEEVSEYIKTKVKELTK